MVISILREPSMPELSYWWLARGRRQPNPGRPFAPLSGQPGFVRSVDSNGLMSVSPRIRTIEGPTELDRFLGLPYTLNPELADDLRLGRRRTEWMWMALIDDSVVARVAWWGNPGEDKPALLDIFDIADPADPVHRLAARNLIETATRQVIGSDTEPPGYIRYVPPDWRDNRASRRHVEVLIDIAEQTGARVFVERLRFEWRKGTPIAPTQREARLPPTP